MFTFEGNKSYRMPAHFGWAVFDPEARACYDDLVAMTYTPITEGDRLAD